MASFVSPSTCLQFLSNATPAVSCSLICQSTPRAARAAERTLSLPKAKSSFFASVPSRFTRQFAREDERAFHAEPLRPEFVVASGSKEFVPVTNAVVLKPAPKIEKAGLKTAATPSGPETDTGSEGAGGRQKELSEEEEFAGKWKVLLHNDEANTMEYVVSCLRKTVPQMTHQEALNIMLEAHTTGVGVVIVCEKEHAEYYCEVLKSYKLWSSIEPEDV